MTFTTEQIEMIATLHKGAKQLEMLFNEIITRVEESSTCVLLEAA